MAFRLLPHEDSYFSLFNRAADAAHRGALRLHKLMLSYEQIGVAIHEIKDIEHEGDKITHETLEKLNKTFITPFEREDIHALVTSIDDILDQLDTAANRLYLYEIHRPTEEAKTMVSVLVRATEEVKKAVSELANLKDPKNTFAHCKEIKRLENESDDVLRLALQRLFREDKNAIELIKWKEIYERLERGVDMCDNVANVLESIVLKHA